MVRHQEIKAGMRTRIEIPVHPEQDPKQCTEWQLVDIPSEFLHHLQQRNQKHFSQAFGTPFTVPSLITEFGFTGTGESVEQLLSGTYNPPAEFENPSVCLLLEHLRKTEEMAALTSRPTISEEEFIGKLKVWRESTSTSPSGLQLGHYKALIARHQQSEVDNNDNDKRQTEKRDLDMIQREIRTLHLTRLINYPLERGYLYHRWQTVANAMLFKETGNIKIHRTRVIHLYEADVNLCMGSKWRNAVFQAEDLDELNQGQYDGGRTRCQRPTQCSLRNFFRRISRELQERHSYRQIMMLHPVMIGLSPILRWWRVRSLVSLQR
jgi:hypothetical protein